MAERLLAGDLVRDQEQVLVDHLKETRSQMHLKFVDSLCIRPRIKAQQMPILFSAVKAYWTDYRALRVYRLNLLGEVRE